VDPINEFRKEVAANIEAQGKDREIQDLSMRWFLEAQRKRYSYNFGWLGRPMIQYPQDIVAMQELIWSVKPDLIIETGIAHGGSLIFSASMRKNKKRESKMGKKERWIRNEGKD